MRFKLSLADKPSHTAPVTCIGWSGTEEVYSVGDDRQLLAWSVSTNISTKVAQLSPDLYPIDMQFLPRASETLGKHGELILLTSVDGKFHIINRNGKVERSVEAHKGAVLTGQWCSDGTGFLTAGEDGQIKIWSRSGMLRSIVVSSDCSVYGACWSPDNQAIAYTNGKCIVIKQLAPNTRPLRWKAHEGIVLCIAWSSASELIVSGGEDCKYRVWDNQGRQMFSSRLHDNHIASIAWSPKGDVFAIGSYNTLRLCDYSGWSRSIDKPASGCIYKMAWSGDGTQLAAACATGHVIFAHVIERSLQYANYIASAKECKTVTVKNVLDETSETLELPERIIQMALRYDHLVLTTPTQCYIYSTNNWNTPVIFDLKEGTVTSLLLSKKHLLLIEGNTVGIYNYQGRLVTSPRWPNMRPNILRSPYIAFSTETLAVRDSIDPKNVYVMDLSSNRAASEATSIQHTTSIIQLSLNQWDDASSRMLAILDKTHDLYLVPVRSTTKTFSRLGRKTESFQWNANGNMIAAIQDKHLIVWYCPEAAFNGRLLKMCTFQYESPELGRNPRINDFVDNSASVRRADGSLLNIAISPYPGMIQKYIHENKGMDALSLCRTANNEAAWACLAVLALQTNSDLEDIAEEAFANINQYERVYYLQYIKTLPTKIEQKAHLALLGGRIREAEEIFLHNGMVFQAIYTNVTLHKWLRALDLAIKHKTHIDTVLYLRQKYLATLGKQENNNKFSTLNETVSIDIDIIEEKLSKELQKKNMNK